MKTTLLNDEKLFTLYDLSERISVKKSPATLYRWCTEGLPDSDNKLHRLESLVIGRWRYSSVEAVNRFIERFN